MPLLSQVVEGVFLKAQVAGEYRPGNQFVFEPQKETLEPLGLSGVESLITMLEEGDSFSFQYRNLRESKVIVPDGVELGRVEPFDESEVTVTQPEQ